MLSGTMESGDVKRRVRKIVRPFTVSGKFTQTEFDTMSRIALESGQLLGEWARDVLLREVRDNPRPSRESNTVLTEIVGLQLFLANVLSPIARGERITLEHYQEIIRQVRANKRRAAADLTGQQVPQPEEQK